MSDTTGTTETTTDATVESKETEGAYAPPATQEDLDKIIGARLKRAEAKYEGFDDLKAKAARLDEIEEANKTELQKYQDRVAALESENGELKSTSLRSTVASDKGVPAALLSGSTKEELEASADALLEFKGKTRGPIVSGDATATTTGGGGSDWLRNELTKK
jgi:hypothetical protein